MASLALKADPNSTAVRDLDRLRVELVTAHPHLANQAKPGALAYFERSTHRLALESNQTIDHVSPTAESNAAWLRRVAASQ